MDKLESLSSTLSQITMYDIKSMYNQAKNVVLNVSEMEAKVREATNDDPWGASSTLMQEIAQATFSFQYFNEVMPCIYARFMEKEARQWRQIYKALQLLEYLVKHGSERVVDDARSHVSTIKMLRNFHYIDDKGKDEGINVRNRSRELAEMLSDVERIRTERRKAKANKHKYTGVGNDDISFGGGGSGHYGGFGSDSFSSGGGGGYGNRDREYGSYASGTGSALGGGSSSSGGFRDESRRATFDEYDAGDDEVTTPARSNSIGSRTASTPTRASATSSAKAKAAAPAPPPVKEENLFDVFGDDDDAFATPAPVPTPNVFSGGFNKALPAHTPAPAPTIDDDDEFADFQVAPATPQVNAQAQFNAPPSYGHVQTGSIGGAKPNLMNMLNSAPAMTASPVYQQPQQRQPQYGHAMSSSGSFGGSFGAPIQTTALQASKPISNMMASSPSPQATRTPAKPATANFDDLWSMSLGSSATKTQTAGSGFAAPGSGQGKSIKDLEKEKALAGLWGNAKTPGGPPTQAKAPDAFGSFGTSNMGGGSSGGGDDLLL